MPEDVTEGISKIVLTPFTPETVYDISEQLRKNPEYLYKEENAFINTYETPLMELLKTSSKILDVYISTDALKAFERGAFIMHSLFRRQANWRRDALPEITGDLCRSFLQDNYERGQSEREGTFAEDRFLNEGERLKGEERELIPLLNKINDLEKENVVYVVGGMADVYFLYRKAIRTKELEDKFRVSPNP